MRVSFAVLGSIGLALVLIGCGSATPGATLAPGQTASPAPQATPAPTVPGATAAGLTGHECDAVPTFSISNPDPSFAPDAALLAHFPTTVDGQPVTDVQAVPWIDLLCLYGQSSLSQVAAGNPGLASMSYGGFTANVDGEDVNVHAFRQPGADGSVLVQTIAGLAAAAGNPINVGQVTPANVGGKSVYAWTDTDGTKGYAYVSGDTMITVDSVTDSQATKIISALP